MIQDTLERARLRNPDLERALQALKGLLLPAPESPDGGIREEGLQLLMRIQQITGPLMAKGFEDTTLYQYNRLLSLNAVGGNPTTFGIPLAEFHQFIERRHRGWPHSHERHLHPRHQARGGRAGADQRAHRDPRRVGGLPGGAAPQPGRAHRAPGRDPGPGGGRGVRPGSGRRGGRPGGGRGRLARESRHRAVLACSFVLETAPVVLEREAFRGAASTAPDPNDEYLLYQTLLGAFPADGRLDERFIGRIQQYLIKATREAKRNTSWIEPNTAYEEGFLRFLDRILGRPQRTRRRSAAASGAAAAGAAPAPGGASPTTPFLRLFLPFQRRVAFYGVFNSLSQLLLKLACPGVPDIYQGTELWDLSLVDPDNRAPVDYAARVEALAAIRRGWEADPARLLRELLDTRQDGRIKLFLLHRALQARKAEPGLFLHGDYLPLGVQGLHAERIVAFARRHRERWAVTAVPRFLTGLVGEGQDPLGEEVWGDTVIELPDGSPARWENLLSGERLSARGRLPAGAAFRLFPACLLLGGDSSTARLTKTAIIATLSRNSRLVLQGKADKEVSG